ncbi:ATP binding cassette subfamily D member Pmp70 [Megachile rotundata]|uniref:ATP binding cassette subfamily D member Pmp70 n=1 Tax=Megachile rotundata TaxID=143995 RepID=UPI000258EADA|nr:PREDICTED: ATP-binding cassette sub-family D member 3 [Megachile rotundata]XP_012144821.1 PREDICTED: ATP-binding cassette sub-family D member 3 [Megachile rotundata]XP_012144822.1 PREDICTED: ATP-binding cassette sub-family D member 3 [Megachile rotundata]
MAPALSKFASKPTLAGVCALTALIWILKKRGKKQIVKCRNVWPANDIQYVIKEEKPKNPKAYVNARFFRQLRQLLKIGIPSIVSAEFGFVLLIAVSLITRSACDLWMINIGTLIESSIVNMDVPVFKGRLLKFVTLLPLISVVNNVLKYGIFEMKLRLRTNITRNLMDQYLKGFTYYKMSNLDSRIANPDQLLTTDVDKFCESCTDLYSNVAKPLLDIVIYVYRLTTNLGGQTPVIMLSYLVFAGMVLTHLRKPIGQMTVKEQRLEGEYRHINSRLITNSEEIAFYQGNNREKLTLLTSFHKLVTHLRKCLEFKTLIGIIDNFVGKYTATIVGFYAVSIPFFQKNHPVLSGTADHRFKNYYTYGRMLVKLAEAIGRLVLAGRELTKLAGFTARVTEIKDVLDDLNAGKYERTMISDFKDEPIGNPGEGKIVTKDNVIRFDRVPLITPNGDILIRELSFEVKSGMNVLVCGPNGCGKSSLFRILGELWPVWSGTVTKPPRGKLFYIPQRPYMTLGTLRDQVIYPHTKEEMMRRGKMTDNDLKKLLDLVQLSHLLERENFANSEGQGWDVVADWMDVLSGGEKQRIAMARLFYHQPQFAILDECTSAVSVDVEDSMYSYCRQANITLFTVSHRRSLWKHHEYYLQMDGRGNYEFKAIEPDTEEFGS